MANSYKILKDVSHSTKTNFYKIIDVVAGYNKGNNAYELVKNMISNYDEDMIDNIYEIFKSVTNSNGSNLYKILNDVWDSSTETFRVKYDETEPFLNVDQAKGAYLKTTTAKGVDFINIEENDSTYYIRVGSGTPFNPDINVCYPTQNLTQALTKTSDTQLVDAVSSSTREQLPSMALRFNGSDNYIDCGLPIQGRTPIKFTFTIIPNNVTSWQGIIGGRLVYSSQRGVTIVISSSGELKTNISNGTTSGFIGTGIVLSINTLYDVIFEWDGLIGSNNIKYTVNGIEYLSSANRDYIGSSLNLSVGVYSTYFYEGRILNYSYTINNQPKVTNNLDQREFYNTNKLLTTSNVQHTFNGVPTAWVRDDRKQSNVANNIGYGVINSQPTLVVPLNANLKPVIPCDVVYTGKVKANVDMYSDAFEANGTDNWLRFPFKVKGKQQINVEMLIKPMLLGDFNQCLYGGYIDGREAAFGFMLYKDNLTLMISDGITLQSIFIKKITINTDYHIQLKWNGLIGGNVLVKVNDEEFNFTANVEFDEGYRSLQFISHYGVYVFKGLIYFLKTTNNGQDYFIPFVGQTNEVYDVNSNTKYTIAGVVDATNWKTQNKYHYFENYGFNQLTNKLPASQFDEGKDVLGNTLSNPVVTNGINGGAEYYNWLPIARIINNDCNYKLLKPASGTYDYSNFSGGSLDGWSVYVGAGGSDASGSNIDDKFVITQTTNSSYNSIPRLKKTYSLIAGHLYKATFKYSNADNAYLQQIYDGTNFITIEELLNGNDIFSVEWLQTTNYATITFYFDGLHYLNNYQLCNNNFLFRWIALFKQSNNRRRLHNRYNRLCRCNSQRKNH